MNINQEIKQDKFENEHHRMLINLLFSADWISRQIKKVLDQYSLTHVQYNILRILKGAKGKPLSAGAIKDVLIFKGSDLTRIIDRLEKKELVERVICLENRRKVDISLKEKGFALLNQIHPAIKAVTNDYYQEQLTSDEALMLNRLLDRVRSKKEKA